MSAAWVNEVSLPVGYAWGDWSGEYRIIKRGGREICRVGGVIAKVDSSGMQDEIIYAIARGERT